MKKQKQVVTKQPIQEPFRANEVPDFKTLHRINQEQLDK